MSLHIFFPKVQDCLEKLEAGMNDLPSKDVKVICFNLWMFPVFLFLN